LSVNNFVITSYEHNSVRSWWQRDVYGYLSRHEIRPQRRNRLKYESVKNVKIQLTKRRKRPGVWARRASHVECRTGDPNKTDRERCPAPPSRLLNRNRTRRSEWRNNALRTRGRRSNKASYSACCDAGATDEKGIGFGLETRSCARTVVLRMGREDRGEGGVAASGYRDRGDRVNTLAWADGKHARRLTRTDYTCSLSAAIVAFRRRIDAKRVTETPSKRDVTADAREGSTRSRARTSRVPVEVRRPTKTRTRQGPALEFRQSYTHTHTHIYK